jgi:hypothetical protein
MIDEKKKEFSKPHGGIELKEASHAWYSVLEAF